MDACRAGGRCELLTVVLLSSSIADNLRRAAIHVDSPSPLSLLARADQWMTPPEWGDAMRDKLRTRLTEWHGFLGRQPEVARQILRKLLVGRLVLTPDAEAHTYTVQGRATYGRLLEGILRVGGLVPPG